MEFHLAMMMIMLNKLVSYFFEESYRASVIILYFCDNVTPLIDTHTEQLYGCHYLFC